MCQMPEVDTRVYRHTASVCGGGGGRQGELQARSLHTYGMYVAGDYIITGATSDGTAHSPW